MKKIIAGALLLLATNVAVKAQQADLRRKIHVSGTAETEITPDILYINISLKEYLENGNSKRKVDIATLEKQLFAAVQKAGIAKENLSISNINSWMNASQKKKSPDFLEARQYELKVNDLKKLDDVLNGIDAKGIQNTGIQRYDYSKMEAIKKELKVKALLAAKEKATYMVEALGGKLGDVLEIQDGGDNTGMMPQYRNYAMQAEAMDAGGGDADLDFKKIKLNFTVNTIFEIR